MTKKQVKENAEVNPQLAINLKHELTEVSMDRIRFPDENPARAKGCRDVTIDKYRDMIAGYKKQLKEYRRSNGKLEKPKFPLPSPKLKRIESDDDGCDLEPVAGCHTLLAAAMEKIETIEAEIYEGSDLDMLVLAIQDNTKHGLPYSSEDIRYNILNLKAAAPKMTYREMAEVIGCSKSHVSDVLKADREEKMEEKEVLSAPGQVRRSPRSFNQQRFIKSFMRLVTKNLDWFTDSDMIELAKASGRIIQILEKECPGTELAEFYYESLRAVVDPEQRDFIDYEGGLLFVGEEKRMEIEAQQRALDEQIEEFLRTEEEKALSENSVQKQEGEEEQP